MNGKEEDMSDMPTYRLPWAESTFWRIIVSMNFTRIRYRSRILLLIVWYVLVKSVIIPIRRHHYSEFVAWWMHSINVRLFQSCHSTVIAITINMPGIQIIRFFLLLQASSLHIYIYICIFVFTCHPLLFLPFSAHKVKFDTERKSKFFLYGNMLS